MENTRPAPEVVIINNDSALREACSVAIHDAFGVVPLESGGSDAELNQIDWSRVRSIILHQYMPSSERLRLIARLKHKWAHLTVIELALEEQQMRLSFQRSATE